KEHANFHHLIEVHKRCQGQINGLKKLTFTEAHIAEKEEKLLYDSLLARTPSFKKAVLENNYTQALGLLSELQPAIAALFDHVKILADDENLKTNRLALLQQIAELFEQVADFQK